MLIGYYINEKAPGIKEISAPNLRSASLKKNTIIGDIKSPENKILDDQKKYRVPSSATSD
ncbi:MAG: hypothetical protein LBI26_02600 [Holosporales bacterium]|jgi:hypothetical protein|nr:hypothetical protein [Holosporales bacterium]